MQGAGFSVIAKEIRALSSQSGVAVNRVTSIVDTVVKDMGEVDSSLIKAEEKVNVCLNESGYISKDFFNISTINSDLNHEVHNISLLLASQKESSSGIKDLAVNLSEQGEPILELVNKTEEMSKQLHKSVDGVLGTASFKLDWHNTALYSLLNMSKKYYIY